MDAEHRSMGQGEEIRLSMPASPDLLRVVRLTAAGLAARVGMNVDEVEDVKIAIDEISHSAVGHEPTGGTLSLRFVLEPGVLVIEGSGPGNPAGRDADTTELSALILAALVDEHDVAVSPEEVRFRLRSRPAASRQ